jgi:predicted DNA-binding protein (MmcQ/YjbR family)
MKPDDIREFCLAFPNAVEEFPFGEETTVFKVSRKMFALGPFDAKPLKLTLKCDPEDSIALREEFPKQITTGYHLNKKHWITITVDALPDDLVEDLISASYALVRPRRVARVDLHPD